MTQASKTEQYVAWVLRHGKIIWIIALLLAIPATARTAMLYAHLKSDVEELLPRESASVLAVDEVRRRMPGLQFLGVVVDTGSPENLEAGDKFIDDLAARVRKYPPDLVNSVRLGTEVEKDFLEKHSALYTDLADLKTIRARIEARRDYDAMKATGNLLDDSEAPPPLDFSDIQKKYDERTPKTGKADGTRYSSKELHLTLMLIEVGSYATGDSHARDLYKRVQADVADLGGPAKYAPGMRIGYSGDVAISTEELSALVEDLSISSVVVIFLVAAVIVLYYRWWRSIIILVAPLLLATVYSFALASLPPLSIDSLNSNTAFLGSIIVGNGINFGIVLLARYVEERRKKVSVEKSLVLGINGARIGTLSAALAAGVSYASLVITQFRGFRQFGCIGGIGMVLSWCAAFFLMPPLVAFLDRDEKSAPKPKPESSFQIMGGVSKIVTRFPGVVVGFGTAITILAIAIAHSFDMSHLEYDFSKLRRADTWTNGEGYWGRKMDELLGTYLTPVVLLADDHEQATAIEAHVRDAISKPPMQQMVANVRTIDDVLPSDQQAKLDEAAAIREDLTPKIRSTIDPAKREEVERLIDKSENKTITVDDLPRSFLTAMRERDGTIGKTVLIYPRPSHALWEGPSLLAFVADMRALAASGPGRPARVAGSLPLSADILRSIQHDGPIACGVAFGGVILVVLILFRGRSTAFYVIGALTVGVLWLLAGAMLFKVKINFANFIAFPITFGIGVDYAVNVVSRYVEDGEKDVALAVRSTGSAVALCSLTTIIGYSSLLMAENRALFLFGLLAVMGEISCLAAGVTFMPAVLALVQRRRQSAAK